jgi:hypothetical protein
MTIKDKDGKPYKLSGPNPLRLSQNDWDKSQVELINMQWNGTSVKQEKEQQKPIQKYITPVTTESNEVIEPPKQQEQPSIKKTVFLCLPILKNVTSDDLYGINQVTTSFGKKYTFEAIIIDENDLMLSFWTSIDISNDSIVFPRSFGKRWWKISSRQAINGGFSYSAITSDINPDFSG